MKKISILLILILTFCLTGCLSFSNQVEQREKSITLELDDEYVKFLDSTNVPKFTFEFDGTLNVIADNPNKFYVQYSNNEDLILSKALVKLFNQYKDRIHVELIKKTTGVENTLFSTLNEYGTVVNKEYTPDNNEEFEEKAFINLENGLKLTIEYRRFVYNGENYYTWSYRTPLSMVLVYPFMVLEGEVTNKLVLISLPTRIAPNVYNNSVANKKVGISNIINGKAYVYNNDSVYYTYSYLNESESKDEEQIIKDNQKYIIDYYVNEMNGTYDETKKQITYTYLGNTFMVELLDKTFKMHYIGKSE